MTRTEFTVTTVRSHRDQLIEINVEYVSWVFREIDSLFGVSFEKIIGMFRGMRLGECVLERLLSDARVFGYKQVCLDSAPFMKAAHRVYENNGFVDRPPYEGVEVPSEFHDRWRFMERAL